MIVCATDDIKNCKVIAHDPLMGDQSGANICPPDLDRRSEHSFRKNVLRKGLRSTNSR